MRRMLKNLDPKYVPCNHGKVSDLVDEIFVEIQEKQDAELKAYLDKSPDNFIH